MYFKFNLSHQTLYRTCFCPHSHLIYEERWLSICNDCMWPLFSWKSYHHNAAVTRLLNNLPSLENKQCKRGFLTDTIPTEKTPLQLVWLKYYRHTAWTVICSSHRDDWGIIVHLSIQTQSWCCHSLPVAVDYTWVLRSVKIQMSHVGLVCSCMSLPKVKKELQLSAPMRWTIILFSHTCGCI